ncbi:MAG: glucose sorbosone dehydrogenase [Gammaproteobacteria bacterium]|nr:glucose sorbosone dehydrogenase [Gammaproteobacteria bacterium]
MGDMMSRQRSRSAGPALFLALLASVAGVAAAAEQQADDSALNQDMAAMGRLYGEHCAVCHGEQLQGAAQGVALVGRELTGGTTAAEIEASIGRGAPDKGMPVWSQTLTPVQIRALAIYVGEHRAGFKEGAGVFRFSDPLVMPAGVVRSERHDFRVAVVAEGLDPLPSSMAFLPDGAVLLTEKHVGLTRIARNGRRTLIAGTPRILGRAPEMTLSAGMDLSNGWMLGVAVHPQFRRNGWIYLSYGDLCDDCPRTDPKNPMVPSMTRVVRGRIRGDRWVDEQVIWSAAHEHYTQQTDLIGGGRMVFDDAGHLFIVIGMKNENDGVQDLKRPWGKIHRVYDDGRIPADNPFVNRPGVLPSIWSYGHRNPQGIDFDERTRLLWAAEHGPRGGDEVNRILPGRNYGWPLTSRGVHYDGTKVDGWKKYGVPYDPSAIEQPVVEFTPSPALSAVIVYRGRRFRAWQDNLLVGSLKARELYRVVLENGVPAHRETLLRDIGRIRDVRQGPGGDLFLLVEHPEGGKILRLTVPVLRYCSNRSGC